MYNKTCPYCGVEFQARVPHTVVCPSKECRKQHNLKHAHKHYDKKHRKKEKLDKTKLRECPVCKKEYYPKRTDSYYCSRKCQRTTEWTRLPLLQKTCQHCGETFTTRGENTVYCSISCINSVCKTKPYYEYVCEYCGKDFKRKHKRSPEPRFCSKKCSNSGENNSMYGLTGSLSPSYGREPWTKGKSAETDERIAALGQKISTKLRDKFANGEMSNAGKNNPMYGRRGENSPIKGIKRSKETRELLSKIKASQWMDGKYNGVEFNTLFKTGWYFSTKLNIKIYYRSSYELEVFKFLDAIRDVITFISEPCTIEYEDVSSEPTQRRNYIPDLLIIYKDGTRKLVEIKPSYLVETKKNQSKFKAAREYCKERGYKFEVWTEKDIKSLL